MKKLIIIVVAILAIAGCKTKTVTTETTSVQEVKDSSSTYSNTIQKDSSYTEKNHRDSVFVLKVPAQNYHVTVENPCDSLTGELKKFQMRAGKATVTSNGKSIEVNTECEELVEYYQSESLEVSRYIKKLERERDSLLQITNRKESKTYTAEIKETQSFWKNGKWYSLGGVLLFVTIIWLAYKFSK